MSSANGNTAAENGAAVATNIDEDQIRLDRASFAIRAGLQYEGQRDVYEVAGYPKAISFSDYWGQYLRGGIAKPIVDIPVEDTWRRPPKIFEPPDNEETEFVEQFEELAKRLRLWNVLRRADTLACIGRYGVLLIGVDGDDGDLERPLPVSLRGPDAIRYLKPYKESDAQITDWEADPRNERFGYPTEYSINLAGGVETFSRRAGSQGINKTQKVHWTRVIHIAEGLLDDDVYGVPALQPVYNYLQDLLKISASSGEAFWQMVTRILQLKIDREARLGAEDMKELDKRLKEIYHNLRRTFYSRGGELEWVGANVMPSPTGAADLIMTLIASVTGIPKRMLFGSETGERASSEDQKSWLGRVRRRQEDHAEPTILRALIDRWIEHRALPRPGRDGYDVDWPELFEEPEADVAEANLRRANAAKALTPVGGDPRELVEIDEDRQIWLIPQTPEEAMALRRENEAAAEEAREMFEESLGGDGDDEGAEDDEGEGAAAA